MRATHGCGQRAGSGESETREETRKAGNAPMEGTVYRLTSGRAVELVQMHVDRTYAGLLEGVPAEATPHVLARVHEDAARLLPPGRPLWIIRDGTTELPAYRLIAELESRLGVNTADPDWASRLFVC
jgi:hypothetical protein